jgi:redox-sensing transcriptional repressor
MESSSVPDIIVGRLPVYLRALTEMAIEGKEITSSQELGGRLGISSAQIRKDLSQFGEFGKQGTGYHVSYLTKQLRRILNLEMVWDMAVVGAGSLGTALANYGGFLNRGFKVTAIFDNDPGKVGSQVGDLTVKNVAHLEQELRSAGIRVAIVAVPASSAQAITDRLVEAGVEAILSFAPTSLSAPESVQLRHSDPALYLQHMTYYLE